MRALGSHTCLRSGGIDRSAALVPGRHPVVRKGIAQCVLKCAVLKGSHFKVFNEYKIIDFFLIVNGNDFKNQLQSNVRKLSN